MSSSQNSTLMAFLTNQMWKQGSQAQHPPAPTWAVSPQGPVEELAAELAALGTLQLRCQKLEERKQEEKYRALFPDGATSSSGDPMKFDVPTADSAATTSTSAGPISAVEALTVKLVPEFEVVSNGQVNYQVVVSLKAVADVVKPANVALMAVVDKSRSMQGMKIELVRNTVEFLAEQLGDKDALGLVAYSRDARKDLPLLLMTRAAKTVAKAVVDRVRPSGGTALHDGLLMGIREHAADVKAKENHGPRRVRSVFLCTDGLPTVGPSDALSIVSAMRAQLAPMNAAEEPVSIHTFGFGDDHDPKLLQAIAEAGGGIYYYIQRDEQIPQAFGDALGGLLSVVASNVSIKVTIPDKEGDANLERVQTGGVLEKKPDDKKQAVVKFADVFADESREVLLELQLPAARQQDKHSQEVVKVEVSYTNPVTGNVVTSNQVLNVTRSASPPQQIRHELVTSTAARFQVAKAMKAAGAASDAGRYEGAEQVLEQAKKKLQEECYGKSVRVFIKQLSDMANAVRSAKANKDARARTTVSTGLTSMSYGMSCQRTAAPNFSSVAPMQMQPGAWGVGLCNSWGSAVVEAAPGGAMPPPPPAPMTLMQGVSTSNAMRQKMSASAADYVARKSKKTG